MNILPCNILSGSGVVALRCLVLVMTVVCSLYGRAADVVVTNLHTDVYWRSLKDCSWKESRTYCINNSRGRGHAEFSVGCNDNLRLISFAGYVTDASGKIIHKFKKSDLQRTELSSELASNNYTLMCGYVPPSYPVTVTFEWEMQNRDNIISFPVFFPQEGFDVAVEHASYSIKASGGLDVIYSIHNTDLPVVRSDNPDGSTSYSIVADSLQAVEREPSMRPASEIFPLVMFSPRNFSYYNTRGCLDTWLSLGNWVSGLLNGRDELPDDLAARLHDITASCNTEYEKINNIYSLLAEHTRYVSIQLGIGGFQPMSAADVWRKGFGDCKALVYFMKSMLGEVGIKSDYVLISTKYKRLESTTANFRRINHVILAVPVSGDDGAADTLWVECTNPSLPLGYLHDGIAGHDAIVLDDSGCHLQQVPEWSEKDNVWHKDIRISLNGDGRAALSIQSRWSGACYEMADGMVRLDKSERQKTLCRMFRLPQPEFGSDIDIVNNADSCNVVLDADVVSNKYAVPNGNRIMLVPSPSYCPFATEKAGKDRKHDIYEPSGFTYRENISINIPSGFKVEACPADMSYSNVFGHVEMRTSVSGNVINVFIETAANKGVFQPDKYDEYILLRNNYVAAYSRKIVLRKSE